MYEHGLYLTRGQLNEPADDAWRARRRTGVPPPAATATEVGVQDLRCVNLNKV